MNRTARARYGARNRERLRCLRLITEFVPKTPEQCTIWYDLLTKAILEGEPCERNSPRGSNEDDSPAKVSTDTSGSPDHEEPR